MNSEHKCKCGCTTGGDCLKTCCNNLITGPAGTLSYEEENVGFDVKCPKCGQLNGIDMLLCNNCSEVLPKEPIKVKGPNKNGDYFIGFVAYETIGCADINDEITMHPERFEIRDGKHYRKKEKSCQQ